MDYAELLENYKKLLAENAVIKDELEKLQRQKGNDNDHLLDLPVIIHDPIIANTNSNLFTPYPANEISKDSTPSEKIQLYLSLFKGRDDVFARRWENKKKETAGYSPAVQTNGSPVFVKNQKCHVPIASIKSTYHWMKILLKLIFVDKITL
jgi:hypothetical protein